MLIFGTRSTVVDGPPLQGHGCPGCGKSEYVSFGAARYFHIFWIPVFPYSRKVGLQCTNCKHTVMGKEIPDLVQDTVRPAVFTRKRTLPLFTGSAIIAGIAAFGFYSAQQENMRELEYIQNPLASDVYVMDFSEVFEDVDPAYKYGVMRVEAVDAATVELSVSNYGYDRASIPASDLRRDMAGADYFAEDTLSIDRTELVELKHSNVIRDIRR